MREILNKKITVSHEYLLSRGCFPASDLAEKYGYAKDHVGWLARTGRIQAIRYGKHGKWYASDKSLVEYQSSLADKPANKSTLEFQTSQINSPTVPYASSFSKDESSYSAKQTIRRDNPSNFSQEKLGRVNAIPKNFLLLVGGILFLSIYLRPFVNDLAPQMARAAMGERTYAGIVDAFRNIIRLFTEDYSTQTYILVDPFRLREGKVKEQEQRIASLERRFAFGLVGGDPSQAGQPATKIIREVIITPSGTVLAQLEQRLDNTVALIEATRINLSNLANDFTSFQRITPTFFQPPSTNIGGIGPITLNPDALESRILNVSGAAVLGSLSVVNDLTVDTNTFYVDSTNNRVGIGTTSPGYTLDVNGSVNIGGGLTIGGSSLSGANLEVGGTASASYLIVGNAAQFANAGATVSYSRFGTNSTSHLLSDASDLLISGNLEIDGSLFIDGDFSLGAVASAGSFIAQSGSAASPSFSFTIDQDSGLFRPAADAVALSTGGVERFRINSSGFFGINTTSPSTVFEVQGTASASYGLFGTLQVGGFSSTSYSRFGTSTTGHANYMSASNDVLVSGDLEERGTASFGGGASVSGNFNLTGDQTIGGNLAVNGAGSSSFAGSLNVTKGIHGLADITATGKFIGYSTASNSFAGSLGITKGLRVTGNITNDVLTASRLVSTNGSKVLTSSDIVNWIAGTTNQITVTDDTDASVTLSLPQNIHTGASPTFAGLTLTGKLTGTAAEFQGTASASYGLFGTLQVGGFSSVSYSRFGTLTTGHSNYISASNDVLVSGDLEVRGTASFAGGASVSGNFNLTGDQTIGGNLAVNGAGSSSFSGSLNVTKGIHGLADITATGKFIGYSTASNSFSGSLGITKGLRVTGNITNDVLTASRLVSTNGSKALTSSDIVNWIAGTTNQITVTDDTDGSVTLSLPQNIHTGASPTFAGLTLTGKLTGTAAEFQGTASASYGLFGTLQVGGFSSVSYSRFGTLTTGNSNYISASNDVLVSGDLEVRGTASFAGGASVSGNFNLTGDQTIGGNLTVNGTGSSSFSGSLNVTKGIHGLADITATGKFIGYSTASNSFSGSLGITKGLRVTGNITNDVLTASRLVSTNGSKALTSSDIVNWIAGTTNQITVTDDTDGSVTLSLPQNIHTGASPTFAGLTLTGKLTGTAAEFQGTASASYGLFGTLQVGGFSSVSYSRFGTLTTGNSNYISASNDVLVSGDLEVRGTASFAGGASVSGNFNLTGDQTIGGNLTVNGTGSSSFSGSLNVTKGIHGLADITATGKFIGYSTA